MRSSHVNALYAVLHVNISALGPRILACIDGMLSQKSHRDSLFRASIVTKVFEPDGFLGILAPLTQVLFEYVASPGPSQSGRN
jgi:hypothetical protein